MFRVSQVLVPEDTAGKDFPVLHLNQPGRSPAVAAAARVQNPKAIRLPAAVGLVTSYDILRPRLLAYGVITIGTTFLVMAVSGWVTQAMLCRKKEEKKHE